MRTNHRTGGSVAAIAALALLAGCGGGTAAKPAVTSDPPTPTAKAAPAKSKGAARPGADAFGLAPTPGAAGADARPGKTIAPDIEDLDRQIGASGGGG